MRLSRVVKTSVIIVVRLYIAAFLNERDLGLNMSEQKTIEQYAEEYAYLNYLMANNEYAVNDFLAGADKQKDLYAQEIEKLKEQIKDYEQVLKEIENDQWVLLKADLIMIQTLANEVLKKWGAL